MSPILGPIRAGFSGGGGGLGIGPKLCTFSRLWQTTSSGGAAGSRYRPGTITLADGVEPVGTAFTNSNRDTDGFYVWRSGFATVGANRNDPDTGHDELYFRPSDIPEGAVGIYAAMMNPDGEIIDEGYLLRGPQLNDLDLLLSLGIDDDFEARDGQYHIGISFGMTSTHDLFCIGPAQGPTAVGLDAGVLAGWTIDIHWVGSF